MTNGDADHADHRTNRNKTEAAWRDEGPKKLRITD
jgi:hypothetical protein